MFVETDMDDFLQEDVILEETDQSPAIEETLKDSENIIKAFMYLQKMIDSRNPSINRILKADTIHIPGTKEAYQLEAGVGLVSVKNVDKQEDSSIYFNGGQIILFPYETIELVVDDSTVLEVVGKLTIIQSEYKLGKG